MTRRILLADDELHILRAAEFKFRRAGFDVICAADGEQAWEAICQKRPDIVVTDCQMPRLDGISLARRISQNPETRDIPVVMLTAKGFELSHQQLKDECGILDVLPKPFSPRELLRKIESLLEVGQETPATA